MPELSVLTIKAITNPEKIKNLDLPGPMIRIKIGQATFWLSPDQANNVAIRMLNLAAVCRDA